MMKALTLNELQIVSGGTADYAAIIQKNCLLNLTIVDVTPTTFSNASLDMPNETASMVMTPGAIVNAKYLGIPMIIHVADQGYVRFAGFSI